MTLFLYMEIWRKKAANTRQRNMPNKFPLRAIVLQFVDILLLMKKNYWQLGKTTVYVPPSIIESNTFDDIIAWYYNVYMHAGFDGWIDNVYIYMYRSMYTDAM